MGKIALEVEMFASILVIEHNQGKKCLYVVDSKKMLLEKRNSKEVQVQMQKFNPKLVSSNRERKMNENKKKQIISFRSTCTTRELKESLFLLNIREGFLQIL